MAAAEFRMQVQNALESPRRESAVRLTGATTEAGASGTGEWPIVAAIAIAAIAAGEDPQRERCEDVEVDRSVAEHSIGLADRLNLVRESNGVAIGLCALPDFVEGDRARIRIRDGNRVGRVELDHVEENAALESAVVLVGDIIVIDVRGSEVCTEAEPTVHCLMGSVDASLQPLEAARDDDSFLIHVVERRAVLGVSRSAGERDIVIERRRVAEQFALPIRAGSSEKGALSRGHHVGGNLLIDVGAELITRNEVELFGRPLRADVEVVLDAGTASQSFLGLD